MQNNEHTPARNLSASLPARLEPLQRVYVRTYRLLSGQADARRILIRVPNRRIASSSAAFFFLSFFSSNQSSSIFCHQYAESFQGRKKSLKRCSEDTELFRTHLSEVEQKQSLRALPLKKNQTPNQACETELITMLISTSLCSAFPPPTPAVRASRQRALCLRPQTPPFTGGSARVSRVLRRVAS